MVKEELRVVSFVQELILRTGGGLTLRSNLIQTHADMKNVYKLHFLKKAI